MPELSELGQILHEEHFRILVAVCELQNRVSGAAADRPLDWADAEDQRLLQGLIASLDHVIVHHAFEETVVFPLFRGQGEGDLAMLLTREHGDIEPKARHLRLLAVDFVGRAADAGSWVAFRDAARELVTEVMRHLEKEELTIVQRLPQFLDADTDHELAVRHRRGAQPKRAERLHCADGPRLTLRAPCGAASVNVRTGPVRAAARAAARRRSTTPPHSPRP